MRTQLFTLGLLLLFCADSVRAELLPADRPAEEVVDHYIAERMSQDKILPASQIQDLPFIRRVTLDLAGRIPTTAESRAFAESTSPNKRVELVDRLLASPDFVFHQRNELDILLMKPKPNDGDFRKYLLWSVEQNRPWDAMFRDMLIGVEEDENQRGALAFLKARARRVEELTNDTAVLFFGVNVSCAQCHDHPLVSDWKQDHFYGMQSFFSRTFLTKKNVLAEKHYGEVKFTTTKGVEKQASFMFLTGSMIEEPKVELSGEEKKKLDEEVRNLQQKDDAPLRRPAFSPREKLVEVALKDDDSRFFSRNIANRVWLRLLGRGLVDPPDQLHSANPPSHPELLDWLARDLTTHQYDLRRIIRGIVLSQAYARSSEWTASESLPGPEYFAVATPRALTPRQYSLSLLVAAHHPEQWPKPDQATEWKSRREQLENAANGWAGQFEVPGEGFQVAVDEALLVSNSNRFENEFLRDSGDRLAGYLKTLPDPAAAIDAACRAILSRPPGDEESAAMQEYLKARGTDQPMAMKQVLWALFASPELRFNY